MTAVLKQSSNNTGLALTREISPNKIDSSAVWYPQEPNTYKNFGAMYKLVARMPINAARQNKKGLVTDLTVDGGWQEDVTYDGTQHKIEGLMYADFRRKAEIVCTGVVNSSSEYTVAAGGTVFVAGDMLFATGFTIPSNNGLKHVTASASGYVGVTETVADDASAGTIVKVGHVAASGDITYSAASKTLASTTLDFTTFGSIVGEWLCVASDITGSELGANIGIARIASIGPHAIVFDKIMAQDASLPIIDAAGTGKTVAIFFGRVIKNELANLIKHYTYNVERTLGMDDTTATTAQAEYLTGGVINEAVFTFNSADKVTAEYTLMGAQYETRTSIQGPKTTGTRAPLVESSAFNTSTDIKRLSLELAGSDTPLYAYVMNAAITVMNNNKPNKAVGVVGSIDHTEGQFSVSAAVTAYFANVTAAQAISNNSSVTLDVFMARDNHGIVFDLPLVTLGDGRPNIKQAEAIQLPLTIDAATAKSLNPNSDYTLMVVFFDYLPTKVAGAH